MKRIIATILLFAMAFTLMACGAGSTVPAETTAVTLAPAQTEAAETTAATEAVTEPAAVEAAEPDYGSTGKILNVLLIGQDGRDGEESRLADSIILCTINRETKVVTLTSFLRDTFLKMPDYVDSQGRQHICGKQRINVNYALGYSWDGVAGGMKMLDQCLYNNFGVEVDCNVELSFDAFAKVVDTLGGVDVVLDDNEAWYMGEYLEYLPLDAAAGEYHLDGEAALAYARMRHSSAGDSDINRTARQRAVISQIVEKARSVGLSELKDLISDVLGMVTTDLTAAEILHYTVELLPMISDVTIESNQCPAPGTSWGEAVDIFGDGTLSNVLQLDLDKNREILMSIAECD